jgi:hypothetical protein
LVRRKRAFIVFTIHHNRLLTLKLSSILSFIDLQELPEVSTWRFGREPKLARRLMRHRRDRSVFFVVERFKRNNMEKKGLFVAIIIIGISILALLLWTGWIIKIVFDVTNIFD